MSFKEQAIEVESIDTSVLIEELKSRDELPKSDIEDFDDDELETEMSNRGLMKQLDEYDDDELEEELLNRSSNIPLMVEIASRISHRHSVGLDITVDLHDLLEVVKLL